MTEGERRDGLERALARTEGDVEAAQKAAGSLAAALKRCRTAARSGALRDLPAALEAAEQSLAVVRQQVSNARAGWEFDDADYLASGAYVRELLDTAARQNLRLFEQDDRLFCYPALIRVLPGERAVAIDKAKERRLRPSVLVEHLKAVQKRPPRFKSEAFLESLHAAYLTFVTRGAKEPPEYGKVVRLLDIYDRMTLLPGLAKDYSRQEFARDLYLLDRSGVTATRKGSAVSFPASSGTRSAGGTLRVITEHGEEKLYYGIAFTPPAASGDGDGA